MEIKKAVELAIENKDKLGAENMEKIRKFDSITVIEKMKEIYETVGLL